MVFEIQIVGFWRAIQITSFGNRISYGPLILVGPTERPLSFVFGLSSNSTNLFSIFLFYLLSREPLVQTRSWCTHPGSLAFIDRNTLPFQRNNDYTLLAIVTACVWGIDDNWQVQYEEAVVNIFRKWHQYPALDKRTTIFALENKYCDLVLFYFL